MISLGISQVKGEHTFVSMPELFHYVCFPEKGPALQWSHGLRGES